MMHKQILALGGSSSKNSINRKFAEHVAGRLNNVHVTSIDLSQFELPLYSIDREQEGIPSIVEDFVHKISQQQGLIVSLAEHNGSYTAAFKNLVDWASRVRKDFWQEKPMLLLGTSPGKRGAASVLQAAESYWPRLGAHIITSFSLPAFKDNFSSDASLADPGLEKGLQQAIMTFHQNLL